MLFPQGPCIFCSFLTHSNCHIPDRPPKLWACPDQGNNYSQTHTLTFYCNAYPNLPSAVAVSLDYMETSGVCRLPTPPPSIFYDFFFPSVLLSVAVTAQSSKHFSCSKKHQSCQTERRRRSKVLQRCLCSTKQPRWEKVLLSS